MTQPERTMAKPCLCCGLSMVWCEEEQGWTCPWCQAQYWQEVNQSLQLGPSGDQFEDSPLMQEVECAQHHHSQPEWIADLLDCPW